MKKSRILPIVFAFSFCLLLGLSFASAGWFGNFLDKILGRENLISGHAIYQSGDQYFVDYVAPMGAGFYHILYFHKDKNCGSMGFDCQSLGYSCFNGTLDFGIQAGQEVGTQIGAFCYKNITSCGGGQFSGTQLGEDSATKNLWGITNRYACLGNERFRAYRYDTKTSCGVLYHFKKNKTCSSGQVCHNGDCVAKYKWSYSPWSTCSAGVQTQTRELLSCLNHKGEVVISAGNCSVYAEGPILSRSCCATYCSSKGTGVSTPQVRSAPTSVNLGGSDPILIFNQSSGSLSYEFWWTYNLANGTNIDFCSCNTSETNSVIYQNIVLSSRKLLDNEPKDYAVRIIADLNFGSPISSIIFRVAERKGANISGWKNNTITFGYIGCTNDCTLVGENQGVGGSDYQYRTCVRNLSSGCYIWSEIRNCSYRLGELFDGVRCSYNNTFNCSGTTPTTNLSKLCIARSSSIPSNAINLGEDSCVSSFFMCIACNRGYNWDSSQKMCVLSNCVNNCTSRGGACLNSSEGFTNLNTTSIPGLTCCSSNSCYKCNSEYHFFNDSCISNNCTGDVPEVSGIIKGNDTIFVGSNNWVRENVITNQTLMPPCRWNCNSTTWWNGSACRPGSPCTSTPGCVVNDSNILNSSIVATGNCNEGQVCRECNSDSKWDGVTCVLTDGCELGQRKAPNGECVDITVLSGCTNGCLISETTCISFGTRMNYGGKASYCSTDRIMKNQIGVGQGCTSAKRYECESNYCKDGKCFDVVEQQSAIRQLLQRIVDWMNRRRS